MHRKNPKHIKVCRGLQKREAKNGSLNEKVNIAQGDHYLRDIFKNYTSMPFQSNSFSALAYNSTRHCCRRPLLLSSFVHIVLLACFAIYVYHIAQRT